MLHLSGQIIILKYRDERGQDRIFHSEFGQLKRVLKYLIASNAITLYHITCGLLYTTTLAEKSNKQLLRLRKSRDLQQQSK